MQTEERLEKLCQGYGVLKFANDVNRTFRYIEAARAEGMTEIIDAVGEELASLQV